MGANVSGEQESFMGSYNRDIRPTAGQRQDRGLYYSRPTNFLTRPSSQTSPQSQSTRVYDPIGGTWSRTYVPETTAESAGRRQSEGKQSPAPRVSKQAGNNPDTPTKRKGAPAPQAASAAKRPRPTNAEAKAPAFVIDLTEDSIKHATARTPTKVDTKPRPIVKSYAPFVEDCDSDEEAVEAKPALSIKVPTPKQVTDLSRTAQSPGSAGSLFVSPGLPTASFGSLFGSPTEPPASFIGSASLKEQTSGEPPASLFGPGVLETKSPSKPPAPVLGPSILEKRSPGKLPTQFLGQGVLDKQPATVPDITQSDKQSLFGSPGKTSPPSIESKVLDKKNTAVPDAIQPDEEPLFVSPVKTPPPQVGRDVIDKQPIAVPAAFRRDKPAVSEESRIKHAQAGATRQTTVQVKRTGFDFIPTEPRQQDEINTESPKKPKVSRAKEVPTTGPISLAQLAAIQKAPDETTPASTTGDAIDQGDEWDNFITVNGRQSTVGQYVVRAGLHGRNARSISNSLLKLLRKAQLESISSHKIRNYVKQQTDLDIPLDTGKPKSTKVSSNGADAAVDESIPSDTSDLSLPSPLASPPKARPTEGGKSVKTIPPGWRAQMLCHNAAEDDDKSDVFSDVEAEDSPPRPVFVYTVYQQVRALADGDDDDSATPPPPEVQGAFTSLAQANAAAMASAQMYTSIEGALQWEYDPDNAARYTLTSHSHEVKAWVSRTVRDGGPAPDSARRLEPRVWEVLVDDAPQPALYSSVEHANAIAASLALERRLKAQPRTSNLNELDLWRAEQTRLIRSIRVTCDDLGEGFSESGPIKGSGDEIWRVSVHARPVKGPLN